MVFSFGLLSPCGRRGPMNQFPLTGTVQGRLPSLPWQKDAKRRRTSAWEGPRSRGPERGKPKGKTMCPIPLIPLFAGPGPPRSILCPWFSEQASTATIMPDVSVVIPVFNEVESIPLLGERLHAVLAALDRSYEILLVDDGSTDDSWEALVTCAHKYPHFRLLRFRRNFGQTAAISAGFHEARGRVIVTLDADLQNDPADIPQLVARVEEGYDVVSGWRRKRRDPFLNRRLPSILANLCISRITGVPLHDYGCTLKAYRDEIVKNLRLYGEMHRFIPALASWVGGRIDEMPVAHSPRRHGTSKYGISRTLRVILDLMTVKFLLRYSTHPIQMFGKIGMFFGVPGILMLLLMFLGQVSNWCFGTEFAADLVKRPFWVITPFMLILFCLQFISMGLLAEIQIRTYHESQNKPTYVIKERVEPSAGPSS